MTEAEALLIRVYPSGVRRHSASSEMDRGELGAALQPASHANPGGVQPVHGDGREGGYLLVLRRHAFVLIMGSDVWESPFLVG